MSYRFPFPGLVSGSKGVELANTLCVCSGHRAGERAMEVAVGAVLNVRGVHFCSA